MNREAGRTITPALKLVDFSSVRLSNPTSFAAAELGKPIEHCNAELEFGYLTFDGAANPFDRSQRFIAGGRTGIIFLPWSSAAPVGMMVSASHS